MIEIKEGFDLCNIQVVRNRKSMKFTFQQNHVKDTLKAYF